MLQLSDSSPDHVHHLHPLVSTMFAAPVLLFINHVFVSRNRKRSSFPSALISLRPREFQMCAIVGKVEFQVTAVDPEICIGVFWNNGSSSSSHSAGLKGSPKNHSVLPSAVCQDWRQQPLLEQILS